MPLVIYNAFWKTDHLRTRTEIHVHDVGTLTHYPEKPSTGQWIAMSAFTDGFYQCCETTRVHFMVLGCINTIAWGTKLLLMAVRSSLAD